MRTEDNNTSWNMISSFSWVDKAEGHKSGKGTLRRLTTAVSSLRYWQAFAASSFQSRVTATVKEWLIHIRTIGSYGDKFPGKIVMRLQDSQRKMTTKRC